MTTIQVYANNYNWMSTGMKLQAGDKVSIQGTGEVTFPGWGQSYGVTGNSVKTHNSFNEGALIYRIGNGTPSEVGNSQLEFSLPASEPGGELQFAINWGDGSGDSRGRSGHFTVEYHLIKRNNNATATLEVKSVFAGAPKTSAQSNEVKNELMLGDDPIVYIMVDHSGSMQENNRKAEAVRAVQQVVDELPHGMKVGLQYFGLGDKCQDSVRTVVEIGPLDQAKRNEIYNQLGKYNPQGYTPIAWALDEATAQLKDLTSQNKQAVLITDGGETCLQKPAGMTEQEGYVWTASEISKRVKTLAGDHKVETVLNMVGIQLSGGKATNMQKWAEEGHGKYYDVANVVDFTKTLMEAASVPVTAYSMTQPATTVEGYVDGPPMILPVAGMWVVQVRRGNKWVPTVLQSVNADHEYTVEVSRVSSP